MDTVPKHKFDCLVDHCKHQEVEIARLRAMVNQYIYYSDDNVWYWQGDGQDYLSTLSCPIIIQPEQLREIIANV